MKKKVTVDVKGMSCASCVINVRNAIEKTPGVLEANVSLASNQATIVFETDTADLETIAKNVSKIGYSIPLERTKANEELEDAKKRLILASIITIPGFVIMFLDMLKIVQIPYMDIINLVLAFPIIFIAGSEVIKRAFKGVVHGVFGMDLLIAAGATISYLSSILRLFSLDIYGFAFVGGMIMFFHLLGKYLEALAKGRASSAIQSLLVLGAKTARIIVDNMEVDVPVQELDAGDVMVVRPGEKIPTDGIVAEGETTVDESMVTGESMAVTKAKGAEVIGGTINQTGFIKVNATEVGEDTFLSQLIALVESAQNSRVPIQDFTDKVISYFVPSILILSFFVFLVWFIFYPQMKGLALFGSRIFPWVNPNLNRISLSLFAAIATLVIACPCALGLATPTALMVASGIGARNGVLIRNGKTIQIMKDVDTVVFDKTGTLTYGKPKVVKVLDLMVGNAGMEILASLERMSEHPIGKAISEYAHENGFSLLEVKNFSADPGSGVQGEINSKVYHAGRLPNNIKTSKVIGEKIEGLKSTWNTVIFLYDSSEVVCAVAVSDTLKDGVKDAINELKKTGIEPVMLTGDNKKIAERIAYDLGIAKVYSEVFPKDKLEIIKGLKNEGRIVAMVGDGINDAPALKEANVGIAIGTGSDIAIESGDIVLFRGDIFGVIKAIKLSNATFSKIKENLFWALFYNLLALPIASLGFLHPVIAEIAMAFSSINVVSNSLRLNRIKL